MEATDLLTDFVGRPKIDAGELDRERGVVIQEIQRYKDQPSAVAEELIDRAAFGDHPLGRTVLGPEEHLRTFTPRGDRRVPRAPLGGRARRARSSSATSSTSRTASVGRAVRALPDAARARAPSSPRRRSSRAKLVEQRETNQSHLRMMYVPKIDPPTRASAPR